METNYLEYQKSIAAEFTACKNRVRNIIGSTHWGKDGEYKEIILLNYLKRVLPKNFTAGTGFVKTEQNISTQIDIIIYDNTYPVLFSEGDFVVALAESVVAIVEVKTSIKPSEINEIIEKCNRNFVLLNSPHLFNGIFSYEINGDINTYKENMHNLSCSNRLIVNNIAIGQYFIKFWKKERYTEIRKQYDGKTFSHDQIAFYDMTVNNTNPIINLSYAYFISNLLETIQNYQEKSINKEMARFLYPIPNGKETQLLYAIDVKEP